MSFHALSEKIGELKALFAGAQASAEKIGALTLERDNAKAAMASLTSERDALKGQLDALNATVSDASGKLEALTVERDSLKAEAEKLKAATPSAQAAAILAQVGHPGVTGGAQASADPAPKKEEPPAHLVGLERAKWFHARGQGITGGKK